MPRGEAQDAAVARATGVRRRRVPDLPGPDEPTPPSSVLGEDRVQPTACLVEHRYGLLHLLRRACAAHLGRGLRELDAGLGQRREPVCLTPEPSTPTALSIGTSCDLRAAGLGQRVDLAAVGLLGA